MQRFEVVPGYYAYADCEQGERSDLTGCKKKEGDGGRQQPTDPGRQERNADPGSQESAEELQKELIFKRFEAGSPPLEASGTSPTAEEISGNLSSESWVGMEDLLGKMQGANFEEMKKTLFELALDGKVVLAPWTSTPAEIPAPELSFPREDNKFLWFVRLA